MGNFGITHKRSMFTKWSPERKSKKTVWWVRRKKREKEEVEEIDGARKRKIVP